MQVQPGPAAQGHAELKPHHNNNTENISPSRGQCFVPSTNDHDRIVTDAGCLIYLIPDLTRSHRGERVPPFR